MNEIVSWAITSLIIVLIVTTIVYFIGLLRLPTAQRPETSSYDRFGQVIGLSENPDYHVIPGTDKEKETDRGPDQINQIQNSQNNF